MQLYQPVHGRLCRYVQSMVWDREEARDLVSETVLTALENFEKLRQPESFLYYTFGIARKLCLKKLRRKKFFGVFDFANDDVAAHDTADMQAELRQLRGLLKKLPAAQHETLVLFEVSGFSIKEIAAMQEQSEGAVKSRLLRARKQLAEMLATDKKVLNGFGLPAEPMVWKAKGEQA